MLRRSLLSISLAAGAASLWLTTGAVAQGQAADWPEQPVTILVPYAAGGNTDMFARLLAEGLDQAFGQRFLVENKPGASGNIGTQVAARSPPDGHTLLLTTSPFTQNVSLFKSVLNNIDLQLAGATQTAFHTSRLSKSTSSGCSQGSPATG